jgi:hypothetical protein
MPPRDEVNRALHEGARRSLIACSVPAHDSLLVRVWRRHRWKIIAVVMFLLIDLLVFGSLGSGWRGPGG